MAEKQNKARAKGKKIGRKRDRSPAQKRYNSERRWLKNKKRKAIKLFKKFGKPIKIKLEGEWVVINRT
jgi:hypothetical protein